MNTATMIYGAPRATGSHQAGNRAAGMADSTGDEPQQRFADVLPVAQAAVERSSENEVPDGAGLPDTPMGGQAVEEQPVDEESADHGEQDVPGDSQAVVWPFPGIVQPLIPRPTGSESPGSQKVKPTEGQGGGQSASSVVQQTPPEQPVAAQQTAFVAAVPQATPVGGTGKTIRVDSPAQENPSIGVVSDSARQSTQQAPVAQQTPATEQPVRERAAASSTPDGFVLQPQNAPAPAVTVDVEDAPKAVQQTPQETKSAPTAQTAAPDPTKADRTAAASEGHRAATAPQAVGQASPVEPNQRQTSPVDATPGDVATAAEGKVEPGVAKAQPANPQHAAKADKTVRPEKSVLNPTPTVESPPEDTTRVSTAVHNESVKGGAVQVETKDSLASHVKEAAGATAEFRVTPGGESVATVRPAATSTQSQTPLDNPRLQTPAQSVGEQILDSIRSSGTPGEREVFVRLQPPELGTVLVRFQERGGSLTGTLEVSSREAQREIEQALPQVMRGLQEAGVQVRRVEVVPSEQPDRNPGGEHPPQDTWQQHQGAGQGREHAATSQARWAQGFGERGVARRGASTAESQDAGTPGRIDVLL